MQALMGVVAQSKQAMKQSIKQPAIHAMHDGGRAMAVISAWLATSALRTSLSLSTDIKRCRRAVQAPFPLPLFPVSPGGSSISQK